MKIDVKRVGALISYIVFLIFLFFFDLIRYGKFAEHAIVDEIVKSVQFAYDEPSNLIDISIPHFWDQAGTLFVFLCISFLLFLCKIHNTSVHLSS